MLNSLLRLWRSFLGLMGKRPAAPMTHSPVEKPYHPSNLHARRH
jgi:hypothetical protein